MINLTNPQKAIEQIRKSQKPILIKAQEEKFNRRVLDYGKFDMLVFPETRQKRNKLKKADSGLNHVSAKVATKNKVTIAYDLEEIRSLPKKQKALELGIIIQDIKQLRKAKTKLFLLNKQDQKNADSLLLSLGASTTQLASKN